MKSLCRHRMSNKSSPMPNRTTDCRDKIAERYDANLNRHRVSHLQILDIALVSDLVVWKAMQNPTRFDRLAFNDDLLIASA